MKRSESAESGFRILPAGDRGLIAEFGDTIDEAVNERVHRLARRLEKQRLRGITELVPTYRSLLIHYDPDRLSYHRLCRVLKRCRPEGTLAGTGKRVLEVPCLYDGEDLPAMTELTGLSREEIISIHSGTDYKIYMLGFLPGFVYLGGLDKRICAPRLSSPRTKIPAGAVGIGGSQTGIYPMESPGGWRLIGRTPLKMYDPGREKPVLCKAGEYIRFRPCSPEEYLRIEAKVKSGEYRLCYAGEGERP